MYKKWPGAAEMPYKVVPFAKGTETETAQTQGMLPGDLQGSPLCEGD